MTYAVGNTLLTIWGMVVVILHLTDTIANLAFLRENI